MNNESEQRELRELVRQTVEMVQQNARDNAFLRGAFEQMDKRIDNLTESVNQRFEELTQTFNVSFHRKQWKRHERTITQHHYHHDRSAADRQPQLLRLNVHGHAQH